MTFWDKLITIFLIAASGLVLLVQGSIITEQGKRVVITVDNREYASYDFSDIEEKEVVRIKTEFGSNTIVIDKNSAYVREASCPDKLDVKMGEIDKEGQMIVCLPNRLMIEIEGGGRKVDKVTY